MLHTLNIQKGRCKTEYQQDEKMISVILKGLKRKECSILVLEVFLVSWVTSIVFLCGNVFLHPACLLSVTLCLMTKISQLLHVVCTIYVHGRQHHRHLGSTSFVVAGGRKQKMILRTEKRWSSRGKHIIFGCESND